MVPFCPFGGKPFGRPLGSYGKTKFPENTGHTGCSRLISTDAKYLWAEAVPVTVEELSGYPDQFLCESYNHYSIFLQKCKVCLPQQSAGGILLNGLF